MSFLYQDGAFPRIVDVAIRGIKEDHLLIELREATYEYPDFET